MRITAEEKAATRKRILDAAKTLFRTKGFEQATTRDIAQEVGIATGTMFNYFASKEAVVLELASVAMAKASREFTKHRRADMSRDEMLFSQIAEQLRALRPLRKYIRPLLDACLLPVATSNSGAIGETLRSSIYDQFVEILHEHDQGEQTAVQLSILWSLYVGVLSFWSTDKSPKQEDSMALLDQSLKMYGSWLDGGENSA